MVVVKIVLAWLVIIRLQRLLKENQTRYEL